MAKGVMFDRASAGRIAAAVRYLESQGIDLRGNVGRDRDKTWVISAKIVTISNDYLTCTRYYEADDDDGDTVYIAKPWQLRWEPFDGQTIAYPSGQSVAYNLINHYTRLADDGTDTETQIMTPEYFVGEIIDAYRRQTNVLDPAGNNITWSDLNTCGRFWAEEPA